MVVCSSAHWCRSRQIFGGAKDFCLNFLKLYKKTPKEWPPKEKTTAFHYILGAIFKIKAHQAQFLPKFPPNLPKFPLTCPKKLKKKWPPKKTSALFLGDIFQTWIHIKLFCKGFHTFCPHFHRFCPDFHQIKSFGGALARPAPPPSTPLHRHTEACKCCNPGFKSY